MAKPQIWDNIDKLIERVENLEKQIEDLKQEVAALKGNGNSKPHPDKEKKQHD